jgi:hypothetical protein
MAQTTSTYLNYASDHSLKDISFFSLCIFKHFTLQLALQLAHCLDVGREGLSSPYLLALGGAGLAPGHSGCLPLSWQLAADRVLYHGHGDLLSQRRRLRGLAATASGTLILSGRAHEVAATSPALPLGAAGHFGPAPPRDNRLTTRACASTARQ